LSNNMMMQRDDDSAASVGAGGRGPAAAVTALRIPLRFRDTDALGHVNHVVHLSLLEEARNQWLGGLGGGAEAAYSWVLVSIKIDYRSELRLEDGEVTARLSVARVGTKSIVLDEQLVAGGEREVARVESVLVAWDPTRRGSRELRGSERAALMAQAAVR
jgi:acyl-CoA thioester hydrolase